MSCISILEHFLVTRNLGHYIWVCMLYCPYWLQLTNSGDHLRQWSLFTFKQCCLEGILKIEDSVITKGCHAESDFHKRRWPSLRFGHCSVALTFKQRALRASCILMNLVPIWYRDNRQCQLQRKIMGYFHCQTWIRIRTRTQIPVLCRYYRKGDRIWIWVNKSMFCIIPCDHRVWNPNPSPNLNPSSTMEISH